MTHKRINYYVTQTGPDFIVRLESFDGPVIATRTAPEKFNGREREWFTELTIGHANIYFNS